MQCFVKMKRSFPFFKSSIQLAPGSWNSSSLTHFCCNTLHGGCTSPSSIVQIFHGHRLLQRTVQIPRKSESGLGTRFHRCSGHTAKSKFRGICHKGARSPVMSLDTGTPNIVLLLAASRDGHTFWVSDVLTHLAVFINIE